MEDINRNEDEITIYHFTEQENITNIIQKGLKSSSKYENFSKIRENVVFCWLLPDHNKMQFKKPACLKITVNKNLCTICDMEYISLAMMYKYGGKSYGGLNTPINIEASNLFVKIYEATAVSLDKYQNHFFTPKVLVTGDIKPNQIEVFEI